MISGRNQVRLKGLKIARAKGRLYVYAWRGGPRLLAPIGSPEFLAEYAKAIESRKARPAADTIAGLILEFRASRDFRALAPATRADHERAFVSILSAFGDAPVAAFADPRIRRDIRKWRDGERERGGGASAESGDGAARTASGDSGDRAADKRVASLSRLLAFALAEGQIAVNPCAAIGKRYRREPDPSPVSEADLARALDDPSADEDVRRAIRVMARSGLARADAASLAWSHVKADRIDKRRQKSRQRAQPPMTPALAEALAQCPRVPGVLTVLTHKGRPWRADGLGKKIAEVFRRLDLDHSSHDLRATYACHLMALGATDEEAAESLGWSLETVRGIRRHYVDDAAIFEGRLARFADRAGTKGGKPDGKRR